jgi:hypothetical protein
METWRRRYEPRLGRPGFGGRAGFEHNSITIKEAEKICYLGTFGDTNRKY